MIGVMSANFDFTNAQKYQEECLVIEVPKNDEQQRVRLEITGKISPDDERQLVKLELKGSQIVSHHHYYQSLWDIIHVWNL